MSKGAYQELPRTKKDGLEIDQYNNHANPYPYSSGTIQSHLFRFFPQSIAAACDQYFVLLVLALFVLVVFSIFYWWIPHPSHPLTPEWQMGNNLDDVETRSELSMGLVPVQLVAVNNSNMVDLTSYGHTFKIVNDPLNATLNIFKFVSDVIRGNVICRIDPTYTLKSYIAVIDNYGYPAQLSSSYSLSYWINPYGFSTTAPGTIVSTINVNLSMPGTFDSFISPSDYTINGDHTSVDNYNQFSDIMNDVDVPSRLSLVGSWMHYMFTWDNDDYMLAKVYVNGTLTNSTYFPQGYWKGTTSGLEFAGFGFYGCLDLPAVWSFPLTAKEVLDQYRREANVTNDNLVY